MPIVRMPVVLNANCPHANSPAIEYITYIYIYNTFDKLLFLALVSHYLYYIRDFVC